MQPPGVRPGTPRWQWGAREDVVLGALVALFATLALWSAPTFVDYDFREPDALSVGLAVLSGAAVAVRTRWPLAALAVASVASLLPVQQGYAQGVATLAPLLVTYTVAAGRPLRQSAVATAGAGLLAAVVLVTGPFEPSLADWFGNGLLLGTGFGVGRSVRLRREHTAGLEERNRALLEAREARSRAVEVDERAAVAREMQDLVTHGLTALTVQTAAARRLLRSDPDTAEDLLRTVERTGQDAIADMRRILGVLRPSDDAADLRPQPGLADIDDLVASARAAGLPVDLVSVGTAAEVEPGVALTAYRLVQEALRNCQQHAGRAAATVVLHWRPGSLSLAVEDDGRGARDGESEGRGLRSLAERVAVYGGRLRAGPRGGGGFTVTATLPTSRSAA
ncbi:Signal transduction histidine kinase [Geodermatophilus saharensis]|uniref:histidine kinase n=1 Tax=Geodermatophilus saharensis TaxID=1137994 RepID=A0A239E585_9ACTN|nr:histidine kinase [Geodermatophilus saharensis]SNS39900.1 Signal transduction histidine kinase [Geodermatophilus saharensis]